MGKGDLYEEKADEFLRLKGYKILQRNFRCPMGEIDIIAKDKKFISFIEVKARHQGFLVSGKEAVDIRKRDKIKKAALLYASKNLSPVRRNAGVIKRCLDSGEFLFSKAVDSLGGSISKGINRFFRFDVLEIIEGKGWREYNLIKSAFRMDE